MSESILQENVVVQCTSTNKSIPVVKSIENEIEVNNAVKGNLNFEVLFEKMLTCVTKFVLSLHNNNNFSRKDVYAIQKSVNNCLVDPILDTFKSFADEKLETNTLIYNEFVNIISKCRNPFKSMSSDYLLNEYLKKNYYIEDINEFTISSEISSIHHSGFLTYDEVKITGTLMPIKFQFNKLFEKGNLLKETLRNMQQI